VAVNGSHTAYPATAITLCTQHSHHAAMLPNPHATKRGTGHMMEPSLQVKITITRTRPRNDRNVYRRFESGKKTDVWQRLWNEANEAETSVLGMTSFLKSRWQIF